MARASVRTFLSLDRYARIMGITPAHFSGGGQINLPGGKVLFPMYNAQNCIWPQYSWQNSDQVSREDLALEIWRAEQEIISDFGFYPSPEWVEGDVYQFIGHYRPELGVLDTDIQGNTRGVQLRMKRFIAGGRRATTRIGSRSVAVVYSDPDGDGWDELATIQVDTTGYTIGSTYEVRLFFENHYGTREWEIRTPKTKVQVGNVVTFTYNTWQMINPDVLEDLPTDEGDGKSIDLSDTSNFVTNVDAYRVYNDTTQNHVEFIDIDKTTNTETIYGGFVYRRQVRDDVVVPVRGTYDATNGWTVSDQYIASDYYKLWYYSGSTDLISAWLKDDDYLSDKVGVAIAYLATARLERQFYANDNAVALASNLRNDITIDEDGRRYYATTDVLNNPFGTKVGEVKAWRLLSSFFTQKRARVAVI